MKTLLAAALALGFAISPAAAGNKNKFPPAPKCTTCDVWKEGAIIELPARGYFFKKLVAVYKADKKAEPIERVLKGCHARYQSVFDTHSSLYGVGWGSVDAEDDYKNCTWRHGWRFLGYRQSNGKITPYPTYDARLDY